MNIDTIEVEFMTLRLDTTTVIPLQPNCDLILTFVISSKEWNTMHPRPKPWTSRSMPLMASTRATHPSAIDTRSLANAGCLEARRDWARYIGPAREFGGCNPIDGNFTALV